LLLPNLKPTQARWNLCDERLSLDDL
jgi:hypothetical protein